MAEKKSLFVICPAVVIVALLLAALAQAQMTPIYRFKGTQIPVKLKVEDKALDRGTYDVEFLRTSSPVLYHIKFMKRGKILGVLQGEEWPYNDGIVAGMVADRTIPDKPTLKMSINRGEMTYTFVFESGTHSVRYPMIRARFRMPYED